MSKVRDAIMGDWEHLETLWEEERPITMPLCTEVDRDTTDTVQGAFGNPVLTGLVELSDQTNGPPNGPLVFAVASILDDSRS